MEASLSLNETFDARYQRAYEQHGKAVFRFVLAWTNDWGSAEDITQETYLRLWAHRASLDWDRPMLPWLLTTARRLAMSRFRLLRRRSQPPTWSEANDNEAILIRWLDLGRALSALSPLERVALTMTAVDGWTPAQLAATLNTSAGAIRAAISRARDKLEDGDA
jgi:RNA polymerase sigma-70 factor (ECF subfamily)